MAAFVAAHPGAVALSRLCQKRSGLVTVRPHATEAKTFQGGLRVFSQEMDLCGMIQQLGEFSDY